MNPLSMPDATSRRFDPFQRRALLTIALTYALVAVGAIVRVTGSGMGCPDWPMCFGLLVPPTSVADLPPLGSYHYPPGWDPSQFTVASTWTEYLNRLLGVLVGFSILATLVSSLRHHRARPNVWLPAFGAFVGVLYAGWLGARVVAHELAPWIVTAHLLSAIAVVSLLVVAVVNATALPAVPKAATSTEIRGVGAMAWIAAGIALLQGALGTQVRGTIEDIARAHPEMSRASWLGAVGRMDSMHRALSWVVVVACFVVVGLGVRALRTQPILLRITRAVGALVVVQMGLGLLLANAGLPQVAQVLHLLVSAVMLGLLTALGMLAGRVTSTA